MLGLPFLQAAQVIDISGQYQLHLQSTGEIIPPEQDDTTSPKELAFDDNMALPGTTDLAKKGPHVTEDRPFEYHLSREYDHIGPAYYKRSITIPADWKDHSAELFLERVMWQSRVWIDGKEVGKAQNSLNTPHRHNLGKLTPGEHELVICVDNRMVLPIGDKGHAYGAQTQSLWNGVVGKMEIRPIAKQNIQNVRVFPELDGTVKVEVTGALEGKLTAKIGELTETQAVTDADSSQLTLKVKDPVLWSEFSPKTYQLKVTLTNAADKVVDTHTTRFGFRKVSRKGNQLLINDTPESLGEAYHPLQAKADVNYWIGRSLSALGREAEAHEHFEASASEAGDFTSMEVVEHSPLSYYRGLSLRELGREAEAISLFQELKDFGQAQLSKTFKIDYFATSLPNLLVFDEDLQARHEAEAQHLINLATIGLNEINTCQQNLE